jgi:hypothetical protein
MSETYMANYVASLELLQAANRANFTIGADPLYPPRREFCLTAPDGTVLYANTAEMALGLILYWEQRNTEANSDSVCFLTNCRSKLNAIRILRTLRGWDIAKAKTVVDNLPNLPWAYDPKKNPPAKDLNPADKKFLLQNWDGLVWGLGVPPVPY